VEPSRAEDPKKPAVWIFTVHPVSEETIEPILWGLEEEGIPAELRAAPEESVETVETVAKRAADGSPLNVGIGIGGIERIAVLHHRDLPRERPLFSLGAVEIQPMCLRRLGVNAARLVKGEPLVFQEEPLSVAETQRPVEPSCGELGELASLIARVVMELLDGK
jgi:hypothetical protein